MDRDLIIMFYGALMGVVGSIVTSLVTTMLQFWLTRHEYERRLKEEQQRLMSQIYLPTGEEVVGICCVGAYFVFMVGVVNANPR